MRNEMNMKNKTHKCVPRNSQINLSVQKHELLRNRLMYIDSMYTFPCGIEYMDMPLNSRNYLAQSFYNDLYLKYNEKLCQPLPLGLKPNFNGRLLRIEYLDDYEKQQARLLNEYLRICLIREQIEALIDCVKCIQFNYIKDDI